MGVFDPKKAEMKLLPWKSNKWKILHFAVKPMVEAMGVMIYREMEPLIEEKEKNGWTNPEVKLLYDLWGEVIKKDEKIFSAHRPDVGKMDHIEMFYRQGREIVCGILDEDSHFTLRFFYMLELLFREQEKFRIEFHKNKAYWDWEKIMMGLMQDDPKWEEHFKDAADKMRQAGKKDPKTDGL